MYSFSHSFLSTILYLLPLALISGSFLPDLIIILSAVVFIILSFSKREFHYYNNTFINIFWVWCSYIIFTSLVSTNTLLSLESSLFYFRFGFFALSVWYIIENNNNFIKYFIWALIVPFFIVIIDGYYQFFTGNNLLGYFYDGVRLTSLFGEEQILGSYLSRLLPLLFALIIYQHLNSKIFLNIIMLTFILSGILIYLSGERSAFFYLILTMIIIIIFIKNWRNFFIVSIITFSILIMIVSLNNNLIKERMVNQTLREINIFSEGRMNVFSPTHQSFYKTALKISENNYVFGVGPKLFREMCKNYEYVEGYSCGSHPHNSYVQLLTETGIIGVLPLIFIFFFVVHRYMKQAYCLIYKKKNFLNNYQICLYTSIIITLWPFAPTGNFFHNWLNVIYFLPLGFLLQNLYFQKKLL